MGKKIIILGAGLSGLSCAYHLKKDYEIYEKERECGGLCRSQNIDGFTFDLTGHLLHFKSKYVFNLVNKLLNNNLNQYKRNSWIFYKYTFTPYPFQANFYNLPKNIIKECLTGLIFNNKIFSRPKNFHEWMLQKFGNGVVNHFMLPYNRKFWGTHPKNLTCEWLDSKIPSPSLRESISGAFEKSNRHWGYNYHFWYPKKGGIFALPQAFKMMIKPIHYLQEVQTIDLNKKMVIFNNSSGEKFDFLVSSIPLTELSNIIYPLPNSIQKAIKKLKYLSILNLNLGISQERFTNKNWIYFPEKKFIFYRIGFFNSFSDFAAPPRHSSLYVEVSYSKDKRSKNNREFTERIKNDLIKTGVISEDKQIVTCYPNDLKYGYIIYDRNCSESRQAILEFLKKHNIFSIGRFGSWRYLSMEESIMEGKIAAENLN